MLKQNKNIRPDWYKTGLVPFMPLMTADTRDIFVIERHDDAYFYCHKELTPDEHFDPPLDLPHLSTWRKMTIQNFTDILKSDSSRKAIIAMPSTISQPEFLISLYKLLQNGGYLFIACNNNFVISRYLCYRQFVKQSCNARAYICFGRNTGETISLVSCRYDIQRAQVLARNYPRHWVTIFLTTLLSLLGAYPWFEDEHIIVIDEC